MEANQETEQHTTENIESNSHQAPNFSIINYKWWFRVAVYILSILSGQSTATLLGRLYYDKGGNSKWMATFVQSAGFPVLIPLFFFFPPATSQGGGSVIWQSRLQSNTTHRSIKSWVCPISVARQNRLQSNLTHHSVESHVTTTTTTTATQQPTITTLLLLYLFLGLILAGDNMMYSYGLLYLPVSTYSLLCATQLGFTAIFSYLLNSQKLTPFILNSLILLTVSASLLAVHSDSDDTTSVTKTKYAIGFICTLGASALYALYLSLVQLSFQKVIKKETFRSVLHMQMHPSIVATCACVVGLFASGEWRDLGEEIRGYDEGRVSYVMTLVWTAVAWQVCSIGLLGLIFEVSSLFSNVISTLALPFVPVLAVIFFHDKMDGVKVVALLLAIWGFVSYVYQHYLDDKKSQGCFM